VHREQWEKAAALFNATELVIAPLMAKDRLVGVVLVDNAFSGNLIEESDVQLLDNLAGQAGLTIDNARTYQALQKAQKELVNAERLAVIGDLTARLSHEIRNPLSTIGGFARRLCKNPEDAQAVLRYASVIVEETERLEELLEDLLEMARPGKITFKPEHLSEVINKALLLADADIKSLNVKVETDYDDSLPIVLLDRARLLQALLNIIRNGAQSMPEGGTLQVSTRQTPGGESVQISIRDQGKGISPNAVKHVFDPFYSTKLKGSGLGLAITWRIIQDHGGKIAVESEPGQGTTFIISLPMRTANST
jgi:signal transduction histidine kinase